MVQAVLHAELGSTASSWTFIAHKLYHLASKSTSQRLKSHRAISCTEVVMMLWSLKSRTWGRVMVFIIHASRIYSRSCKSWIADVASFPICKYCGKAEVMSFPGAKGRGAGGLADLIWITVLSACVVCKNEQARVRIKMHFISIVGRSPSFVLGVNAWVNEVRFGFIGSEAIFFRKNYSSY